MLARIRALTAGVFRLSTAVAAAWGNWNIAAFQALRGVVSDLIWISIICCLVAIFGTAVFYFFGQFAPERGIENYRGWLLYPTAGWYFLMVIDLLLARRTLHAAGLLLQIDIMRNIPRWLRGEPLKVKDQNGRKVLVSEPFNMELVMLQFAGWFLWILLNCFLNVIWYMLLIPIWGYWWLAFPTLLAGLTWVISHRELQFDWFRWFGTYMGYFFVGASVYMLADHWKYDYPLLAGTVAFLIVMLATNKKWWRKAGGWKWAAATVLTVILLSPFIGPLDRAVSYTFSWNDESRGASQAIKAELKAIQEELKEIAGSKSSLYTTAARERRRLTPQEEARRATLEGQETILRERQAELGIQLESTSDGPNYTLLGLLGVVAIGGLALAGSTPKKKDKEHQDE